MTLNLEEQSFRNLVRFYASELKQIIGGARTIEVFGSNTRMTLHRHGVLEFDRRTKYGSHVKVSEKARRILERST